MAALVTDRLRLRLLAPRDAALFVGLYTDAAVMARIMPPLDVAAATRAFEAACRHNGRANPGHRHWAIEARDDGRGLGIAALLREGTRAELGVMLRPEAWNRRVSGEAFAALLPHAFEDPTLALIDAQRPDDDHALRIDRLLAPFGFIRGPATRPGCARWLLPRPVFMQRNPVTVGIQPPDR
jgi:hypothetical protein